ncbi:MAG: dehydratase [Rhizobiales bacterium PAR1]|nr:MAG: dehydratase [Rhizobiales bacterium PAR1]
MMPGKDDLRYFEDFIPGVREDYGSVTLTEAAIIEFAREFDPQPMHLDGASAQAKEVGGLIASGWHTCSLNMRMMADHFILKSAGMGSPGVSKVRWLNPVRPGDTLTGVMEVLDKRASASKPDRGFVDFRFELKNQHGKPVLEQTNLVMYARRTPGVAEKASSSIARPAEEAFPSEATAERLGYIGDMVPGTVLKFGTYDFEAPTMIHFAERFDPQAFHLDEAIGKASHFGGLSASGWHTASAWMRVIIDFWAAREAEAPLPKRGMGFGFDDLQWKRPVLAGDRLTFYGRILSARKSTSLPGWGIITQRSHAVNQNGVVVFAFTTSALWQARP